MEIVIAVAVIFVGSYVQSSIGFGLAIIAAPVLFFIDPVYVPAPITISAFTLSLANAAKHWHSISFEGLKFAIIGRIPGTIAGGLLLFWIGQEQLAAYLEITNWRHGSFRRRLLDWLAVPVEDVVNSFSICPYFHELRASS